MRGTREGFDEHDNPVGKAFDLGGVDDERLRGEKILLYVAFRSFWEKCEWHHAQQAVAERNIQMDIVEAPGKGRCSLQDEQLAGYTQLWFVSDKTPTLRTPQVQMIADYVRAGNGLLIWADNDPYYADANLLAEGLIGTRFSGNKTADRVMVPGEQLRPGHFIEHPLTHGVNQLYEGITICTIAPAPDLTILAQSHDKQMCMACFERGEQRIVLDTGLTKLYRGAFHKTAGTARYFRNIAFWLARGSRGFQYTNFTPGRGSTATIDPGMESPRYKHTVTTPTAISFMLMWEGAATLGLVVQDPHGRIVYNGTSGRSPVRYDVPAAEPGDWVCWVRGVTLPRPGFPYVLSLMQNTTATAPGIPRPTLGQNAVPPPAPALRPALIPNAITAPPGAARPVPGGVPAGAPHRGAMYARPWGSAPPAGLIILLDQSGAMNEPFTGGQAGAGKPRGEIAATVLNSLVQSLIQRHTRGGTTTGVELAVLGYGGRGCRAVLGGGGAAPFATLADLRARPLRVETRRQHGVDTSGNPVETAVPFPIWVEAQAEGARPLNMALAQAREAAAGWTANHPNQDPPVVVNILAGPPADGDLTAAARALTQGAVGDGALLFHGLLASGPGPAARFPNNATALPPDPTGLAPLLFALASVIPAADRAAVERTLGGPLAPNARGLIVNGDAAALRQIFGFAF